MNLVFFEYKKKREMFFDLTNVASESDVCDVMQVESEGEAEAPCAAVLTPPLSLEGGLAAELRPANLVQRVLSLFRNVRPGSDLSHFQVRACATS